MAAGHCSDWNCPPLNAASVFTLCFSPSTASLLKRNSIFWSAKPAGSKYHNRTCCCRQRAVNCPFALREHDAFTWPVQYAKTLQCPDGAERNQQAAERLQHHP